MHGKRLIALNMCVWMWMGLLAQQGHAQAPADACSSSAECACDQCANG